MTEEQDDTANDAPEVVETESSDDGLAGFAAMEAKHGLGLSDDDAYAAKTPVEDDAPEQDRTAGEHEEEESGGNAEESSVVTASERESAIRALRRAKTPQSVIDSLSDDDLVAWGTDLSKIQSDVDKKLSATKEPEPETDGTEPQGSTDTTPQAPSLLNWDQMTAPLKDTFGDDDAEAMVAPMRAVFDTLQHQNQMLSNVVENLLVKESFRQLEGRYPQLADPEQQLLVQEKVRSLNTAEYQSIDDLIGDAARLVLGSPRDAAMERRSSVSRKKSAGQTRSTNRRVASQPMSDFDNGMEMFKALEEKYGLS